MLQIGLWDGRPPVSFQSGRRISLSVNAGTNAPRRRSWDWMLPGTYRPNETTFFPILEVFDGGEAPRRTHDAPQQHCRGRRVGGQLCPDQIDPDRAGRRQRADGPEPGPGARRLRLDVRGG